jgi:hypothetical protein
MFYLLIQGSFSRTS